MPKRSQIEYPLYMQSIRASSSQAAMACATCPHTQVAAEIQSSSRWNPFQAVHKHYIDSPSRKVQKKTQKIQKSKDHPLDVSWILLHSRTWNLNWFLQSSDLRVSMIRSDYPSNAQGNDQRDLLPYVLNIYSCLYPDDFTSWSKYLADFTSPLQTQQTPLFHGGDKISIASTLSITWGQVLRAFAQKTLQTSWNISLTTESQKNWMMHESHKHNENVSQDVD